MKLKGKTAVITGASRGLGRQLALVFAGRGARLLLLARNSEQLAEVAEQARGQGVTCEAIVCDLADSSAIAAAAERIHDRGGVDVLVNNAGIGSYKPFLEHSLAEHDAIIDANLRGVVHLTQHLLPGMLERGSGHIVSIASDLATRSIPNMVVYSATKFALRGFSLGLATEVKARGVKVSLINPGVIDTCFNGAIEGSQDAFGALQPDQLAALIVSVIEQPGAQMIDELTVHPQGQEY